MTAVSSSTAFPTPAATTPSTAATAGAVGSSNGNNVGAITNQSSLNSTENEFLTLLTTQLQNQDPTSPMDTSQFTSELVSLSQVQQQLDTNQDLSQLVTLGQNNQSQLGLSYMGLNVSVDGSQFSYNPTTDASVTVGYDMSAAAAKNTINVLDSNGNTVYTTTGSLAAGQNSFTWNGAETNGGTAPAGTYTVQVVASTATNTPVSVTTQVPGTVTGMQTGSDGTVELMVGSQLVPLANVTSASIPQTASTTN